jgi:hypothetical protein
MVKIISYCGITCSDCPTFIATQKNDNAERERVAELWTKQYGHPFKATDINCDGCQTRGTRVFNYTNICEIRKCGQQKNIENCAHCEGYKCEKISKLHEQAPQAKETLDEVRKNLNKNIKR